MRKILAILAAAGAVAMATAQGGLAQQSQISGVDVTKNPALADVRVDQAPGVQLPLDTPFRDQSGKAITLGDALHGRPTVLLPIFYRCTGVCNVELQGLLNALIKRPNLVPGRDLNVVVLGINPTETPSLAMGKLKSTLDEYEKPEVPGGWTFMTGTMPDIRKVTDAMGFQFTYDAAKDRVNHPSGVMVLTPKGAVSSYMLGGTYRPDILERDLARAAKEEVAPKSTDLFFGCVHLDPVTGRRSIVIENVLKVMGIATVAGMILTFLVLNGRVKLRRTTAA